MQKTYLSALALLLSATAAHAECPLATGRWAKVSVDTTGIFEISYESLREFGFPDPSKVAVYGSGGVVAADNSFTGNYGDGFAPAPYMHTADGRILFFAEGTVRGTVNSTGKLTRILNNYDTKAYYFLTDKNGASEPPAPQGSTSPDIAGASTTHRSVCYQENQLISPSKGGAVLLGKRLNRGVTDSYSFPMPDYDTEADDATFYYEYGMKNEVRIKLPTMLSDNVTVSRETRSDANYSRNDLEAYKRGNATYLFHPENDNDTLTVEFSFDEPQGTNFAAIDFAYVTYNRRNSMARTGELLMQYATAPTAVQIADAPADVVVWNVTPGIAGSSRRLVTEDRTVYFDGSDCRLIAAFSPSARHRTTGTPEAVGNSDLADESTPDILIICAPALRKAADELAELHRRYQGLDVLVAEQDAVFDEFSEGSRTPMAFRRLAKTLYDRNPEKLRNIILYGSGSYINTTIDNKGTQLVTYQTESTNYSRYATQNYCGDQYFGMLATDYNHSVDYRSEMLVNVGRIGAASLAEGAMYNAKVRRFFEEGPRPDAFLRTAVYSGIGDNYGHIEQAQEAADSLALNPYISTARFDNYFYQKTARDVAFRDIITGEATRLFSLGAGLLVFAGHANGQDMEGVLSPAIIGSYNCTPPPFGVFASCDIYGFDRHGSKSVCDLMTFRNHGGLLGSIASSRTVILQYNRLLSTAIARAYATLRPGDTYGDILRRARADILSNAKVNTEAKINSMCYNFCGDPALPVPVPEYSIIIDEPASASITPMKAVTVSGTIVDAEGNIADTFNGDVRLSLHAASRTKKNYIDTERALSADDEHDILVTAAAKAAGGRFAVSFTVPVTGVASTGNRMTVTAVSDDRSICAAGVNHLFSVTAQPAAAGETDTTAPSIIKAYIDTEDFAGGDVVPSSFVFHAVIDPSPSGIRTVQTLEPSVRLEMDGSVNIKSAAPLVRLENNGNACLEVPFDDVALGKHTLTLTVTNNAGVQTTCRIDFTVGNTSLGGTLTADWGDSTAARDNINFGLDGADGADSRIIITDDCGRTVLSRAASFPYLWDLSGNDGTRVPDGSYRAWVVLSKDKLRGSTEAVHFTVLRERKGNK